MVKRVSYRINEAVKAPEIRLIGEKGEESKVMPTKEALTLAREAGLDLVEIAPGAKPPVARITNFQRFLFQKEKEEKASKKGGKSQLKEFRIRPNIGDNDLEIRTRRAEEFLRAGDRVKLTVVFRGREITHPEVGLEKVRRVIDLLKEVGSAEKDPQRMGRTYEVLINPLKRS
ncbi:translation initiation factor IF-3 [candidate division WWE3 bacterium RIFCSPHIGHO2_01_FULL_48_15]|uniref:Translation initiation factor IF-3 n=1 Tax=candidate division WWE3 bacterium RIFCSPHIGHO2_01_FULL_48_15 TaxID=1802619 RepID=A0A1F4VFP1_UNCKA|nr:MAG: translation initiation factor IF-3 [candidate division WWE3 bacterium RIFCSPHIGHO2_01_FULL_48_15]